MDDVADSRRHPSPAPPTPRQGLWLLLVVFVAGAALMAFELTGSRVLAPYFGNSIYVWGSLIGVFLGALAIGYAAGGLLADRLPRPVTLASVLAVAAVLVALVVPLADVVQQGVVRWNPGVRLNPLVAAIVLFGPASVLIGTVSPLAVRLRARDIGSVGTTAGSLYGLSTAGSIVGTIGSAFWLIQAAGTEATLLLIALSLAACALVAALASHRVRMPAVAGVLVATAGVLALGTAAGGDPQLVRGGEAGKPGTWSPVLRAGDYREPFEPAGEADIRHRVDSPYHRITVADYAGGVREAVPTRVLHFDSSLQAATRIDERGKPQVAGPPVFSYLRIVDLLAATRPDMDRALFIGLGSGAAPMRLRELDHDVKVDVVEIDPEVVTAARRWFGYEDGDGTGIETYVADGRSWLAASRHAYDVIYVDAYYADSIPFHLTTREFFQVVEGHLADDGIAAANLIGAVEGGRNRLLGSMVDTWRSVFRNTAIYPVPYADGAVRLDRYINVQLLASNAALPRAGSELALLEEAGLRAEVGGELRRLLDARYEDEVAGAERPLLTDDYAPVDSLLSIDPEDA